LLTLLTKPTLANPLTYQESYEAAICVQDNNGEIMRKTKMMLLGVLLACASGAWAATGEGIQKYELDGVTADFKQFHIGDTVPPLYLTPEYNIKQWQQRNLPAPDAGTRWTYMGGSYVLITEPRGKSSKFMMARFSTIKAERQRALPAAGVFLWQSAIR
jgi:Ni/Co efflux regulator RcnB